MFVYIATDHAGFELKNQIIEFLENNYKDFIIKDYGAKVLDKEDDYTDFIYPSIKDMQIKISENQKFFGIILGGSGTGEAILANRFSGIRAVVSNCQNLEIISLSRMHNDCNVISFGARFVNIDFAKVAIKTFLETEFLEGKHKRRIEKIDNFKI
jgi:ribose 5-phosphate isomerase B